MDIDRQQPPKAYWEGAPIAVVGLSLAGVSLDWHGLLTVLMLGPALVLIASGIGLLLWPGDARLPQYASLACFLAAAVLPLVALAGDGLSALGFVLALILAYLAAGRASLHEFPRVEGAPDVPRDARAAAHIGTDQALLAWFKAIARPPRDEAVDRIAAELEAWEDWLRRKRLRRSPQRLHPAPPDLLKVDSRDRSHFGQRYRHIRFDSGYAPESDMPGAARWLGYAANRTAHAWVLEHPGAARPWLLAIHGYRMGVPLLDLRAFRPEFFHKQLGLNLACLVLPLHGPRKKGLISGEGYLEGDILDFMHAERQAQWDLRRLLSWLRLVKRAPRIGVYGLSLGGYNAALLAGLDAKLDAVIAGIPVADMAVLHWRHFPPSELAALARHGVTRERVEQAYAPVSPLTFRPQLARDRLGIFAGGVDALVWPDQPLKLQQHWDGARLNWYPGAHLTFYGQHAVEDTLRDTLAAGGLLDHDTDEYR